METSTGNNRNSAQNYSIVYWKLECLLLFSFRFFSIWNGRGKKISIHVRVVGSILTFQLPESITVKER